MVRPLKAEPATLETVLSALEEAGFKDVQTFDAEEEFGKDNISIGRKYFLAQV